VPGLEMVDSVSHPEDVLMVRQILKKAIQNKEGYAYERRIFRPDGQMRHLHSNGNALYDSDGNIKSFIGIVTDITTHKQAAKVSSTCAVCLRNTPDIINRWNKDLEMVFASQPADGKNQSPGAALYLQHDEGASQPGDTGLVWHDTVKRVFETGKKQDHYSAYTVLEDMVYYHTRLVPGFSEDGTVNSVLAIAHNMSDYKRLERENLDLRLNQQKEILLAILDTQKNEHTRIAEGLHNGIGQLRFAAKISLDQFIENEYPENAKAAVRKADLILVDAINQTRSLSHNLTPSLLDSFGLEVASKHIGVSLTSNELHFKCWVFNLRPNLEKYLQVAVYRMAQELANNAGKHAAATK